MNVLVLYGGVSSERESSLKTGARIADVLSKRNHEVRLIDYQGDYGAVGAVIESGIHPDVTYIALHGGVGENGTMQGFLDILGMRYVGTGVMGSALAMNKYICKKVLRGLGCTVPRGILLRRGQPERAIDILKEAALPYPLVVKPNSQGSKKGIYFVESQEQLLRGITESFVYDNEILVEEYIDGREMALGMICVNGDLTMLPIVELEHNGKVFDYCAKTPTLRRAKISPDLERRLNEIGKVVFKEFQCRHIARIDLIQCKNNEQVLLEVNVLPGMGPTSVFPKAIEYGSLDFDHVIDELVNDATYPSQVGK